MKTVIFSDRAAKQLDALPIPAQERIVEALVGYAMTGAGDVKRLVGREGCRMRVGDYRVIFAEDQITVVAVYVGRRDTTTYNPR